MQRRLSLLLWLLVAAAAVALSTIWAIAAKGSGLQAWALLPLAASVALLVACALQVWHEDSADRYRRHHKPLAGPRPGARLPQ